MCYWINYKLTHTEDCTCDWEYENGKEAYYKDMQDNVDVDPVSQDVDWE